MEHCEVSLQSEINRIAKMGLDQPPPTLSVFEVHTSIPFGEYDTHLREVLKPTLELAARGDLSGNDRPPFDTIPAWFKAICSKPPTAHEPQFSKSGKRSYQLQVEDKTWSLESWLFQFDPEMDTRGWQWWDTTFPSENEGEIWVDSWGEDFFGCQELRWLAYTAGATRVSGPRIASRASWEEASTNGNLR